MSGIFKDGYFTEDLPQWPGRALSIRIVEPIASEETECHLSELFRGEGFGLTLALDGRIQLAESDEPLYHEMFAHTPAYAHPDPETVLIIGGADGGLVRELLKHPCIDRIDLCDRDSGLVDLCRKHIPWTKKALDDFRTNVIIDDAKDYVKKHRGEYDLILVDGPDYRTGGGITVRFLADCKKALRPGGILTIQSGSHLLHTKSALQQMRMFRSAFQYAGYFSVNVPSFPGGCTGFCIGSDEHSPDRLARRPFRLFVSRLKMYSIEMHKAAFVMPPFWNHLFEREME